MKEFYIYIVQVNVGLLLFYLLYRILFSRDTFIEIRRLFLFTILVFAFIYPTVSLPELIKNEERPLQVIIYNYAEIVDNAATVATPVEKSFELTWQHMILLVWGMGSLLLVVRMIIQLIILCCLAQRGKRIFLEGQQIIALKYQVTPFSFFHWIFIHPGCHEEKELSEIIAHEQAHVRQWHSVDMLLGEFLCIFFWFNPIVWLLRREVRQNLEFLADKNVVCAGYNRKNYQYHLLRLSHQTTAVHLVNNFNVSSLKKRIIMMNRKRTSRISLIKYGLLLPVTGLLILSANARVVAEAAEKTFSVVVAEDEGISITEEFEKQEPQTKEGLIKGKVTDEGGKPLRGVSIVLKNTSKGTVTDENGEYQMKVPESGILYFSYVGKKTEVVPYTKGLESLNVMLKKTNTPLEDVVIVGYMAVNSKKTDKNTFSVVEQNPEFIGGGSCQQFIAKNIKYPAEAMKKGIEGTVYVTFTIDAQGKVVQPKVLKGVNELLDNEALRVVSSMPDWKPGKQRGQAVEVQYTVPVQFHISKGDKEAEISEVYTQSTYSVTSNDIKNKAEQGPLSITTTVLQATDMATKAATTLTTSSMVKSGITIVDGKRMSVDFSLKTIPENTIKSITVLKDSTAISIYGKEAKDGVIIIQTREE